MWHFRGLGGTFQKQKHATWTWETFLQHSPYYWFSQINHYHNSIYFTSIFQSWVHVSEGLIYSFASTTFLHNCINLKFEIKPSCRYNSIYAPKKKICFNWLAFDPYKLETLSFTLQQVLLCSFYHVFTLTQYVGKEKTLEITFWYDMDVLFPFLFIVQTNEPYYDLPILIGKRFGWHVFVWCWKTHWRNDFNTLQQKLSLYANDFIGLVNGD